MPTLIHRFRSSSGIGIGNKYHEETKVRVKIGVSFHVDQSARLLSTNEQHYSLAEKKSLRTAQRQEKFFNCFVKEFIV